MANHREGPAIGIDLGTTYSCVAVWKNERVEIIVNDQGNRTTPSYVAFTPMQRLVGDAAKNQVARNPTNSVFGNLQKTCFIFIFRKKNNYKLGFHLPTSMYTLSVVMYYILRLSILSSWLLLLHGL